MSCTCLLPANHLFSLFIVSMTTYLYKTEQFLHTDIRSAWNFFSSAKNLARITPPEMDFKILTDLGDTEIYVGMIINYTVKPLFGIPVHWRTEIQQIDKPKQFTDKQVKGPYKLWEHTHLFFEREGGILMQDEVKYQLPFGFIGAFAHWLIVRKKLEHIFNYRRKVLHEIFPRPQEYAPAGEVIS